MKWNNHQLDENDLDLNSLTTCIGLMSSADTAKEAIGNLSFDHGERKIIDQKSETETIIMISGDFKESEIKEIKQAFYTKCESKERIAKALNPIFKDLSKRKLNGKYLLLTQQEKVQEIN